MERLSSELPEARERLQIDGAVRLEGVLGLAEIATVCEWIDALSSCCEEGAIREFGKAPGARAIYANGMFFCERASLALPAVPTEILSKIGFAARELMGGRRAAFWRDELFHKDSRHGRNPTPWHHGLGSFPFKGVEFLTVWIALTPVGGDSAPLQTIRGSHRTGARYRPPTGREHLPLLDGYEELPDFDAMIARGDVVADTWLAEPGDLIAFFESTVHGALANTSERTRRAYVTRWLGDDVAWLPDDYSINEPRYEAILRRGQAPDDDVFDFVALA